MGHRKGIFNQHSKAAGVAYCAMLAAGMFKTAPVYPLNLPGFVNAACKLRLYTFSFPELGYTKDYNLKIKCQKIFLKIKSKY